MTVCCIPAGGGHDVLVSLITGVSWVLVLAGRFVAGRPLDGRARTNCTYRRRGTEALAGAPVPGWWVYRPVAAWWSSAAGWERQAIRLGATAWSGLVAYGWLAHPVLTLAALAGMTGAGVVLLARRGAGRGPVLAVTAYGETRSAERPVTVTATVLDDHTGPWGARAGQPVVTGVRDSWDEWQCGGLGGFFTDAPAVRDGQGRS